MHNTRNIGIEEQKELQLEILKELKRICDGNNLTYFLGGGTLLGAVRHKGYIPWDDDIDIMMPRKDYDKLLKIFNNECDKKYKLLYHMNTNDYYYPFGKIVHKQTKLIEENYRDIKEMGIFIDVFPIDFLPNNEKEVKKIFSRYKKMYKIVIMYQANDIVKATENKVKLLLKRIILPVMCKFKLHTKILTKIDKMVKQYKDTDIVACVTGRYFEKEVMNKSYIKEFTTVKFEDEEYKIPIGYDEYLKKHYGNYMELPPKDKQISNHDFSVYWR